MNGTIARGSLSIMRGPQNGGSITGTLSVIVRRRAWVARMSTGLNAATLAWPSERCVLRALPTRLACSAAR